LALDNIKSYFLIIQKSSEMDSLHSACYYGDIRTVMELLSQGEDINEKDDWLRTPLHAASQQGHMEVARLLIENSADIDATDEDKSTPLDFLISPNLSSPNLSSPNTLRPI